MSDLEPELPAWLVDAVLSQEPPPEAVDLVKQAFTWRTIEAELMELSYDSVLDAAGVRDDRAVRTLEFSADGVTMIVEVDGLAVRGRVVGRVDELVVSSPGVDDQGVAVADGGFVHEAPAPGPLSLKVTSAGTTWATPTFTVG